MNKKPYERKWVYHGKQFSVTEYPHPHHKAVCQACNTSFWFKRIGAIETYDRRRQTDGGAIRHVTVKKRDNRPVCYHCARCYTLLKDPMDGITEFLQSFRKDGEDENSQKMPWV
jgi:hypothetical protein